MYGILIGGWPLGKAALSPGDGPCPEGHEHPGPWREACAFCRAIYAREQAKRLADAAASAGADTTALGEGAY
jgi:hypothetical protein